MDTVVVLHIFHFHRQTSGHRHAEVVFLYRGVNTVNWFYFVQKLIFIYIYIYYIQRNLCMKQNQNQIYSKIYETFDTFNKLYISFTSNATSNQSTQHLIQLARTGNYLLCNVKL